MDVNALPPGVGPHEGRELELLLKGSKPVARFSIDGLSDEYEIQFRDSVESGRILEFDFPASQPHLHRRYYCLPGEEWRVKLMELILHLESNKKLKTFSSEELHRIDGYLLGYSKDNIDAFIEHWKIHGV